MLNEIISAFRTGLTASCLFLLGLLIAACVGLTLAPFIREQWAKAKKMKPLGKAVGLLAVVVAIAYGGAKPPSPVLHNAGADEGINLVSVMSLYDASNNVTKVEVQFIGSNVGIETPISVRNDETENWLELVKINPTVTSDLPTNILRFTVSGNVDGYRFWWVGVNTPAVIVESEGIEITCFAASSHSVQIDWTCEDPNAAEFEVQRRHNAEEEWQTVCVTTDHAFIFEGFTVGETWEWRVITTYEMED